MVEPLPQSDTVPEGPVNVHPQDPGEGFRRGIEVMGFAENASISPAAIEGMLRTLIDERPSEVSACVLLVPESVELDNRLFDAPLDLTAIPAHIKVLFVSFDRKIAIMLGMVFALHPADRKVEIVHTMEEALVSLGEIG